MTDELASAAGDDAADGDELPRVGNVSPTAPLAPLAGRSAVRPVAAGFAAMAIAVLLTGSGFMAWQHHRASEHRRQVAEFAAAARQGVVNLMSIDYKSADESVRRVLDGSTGKFRTNFEDSADDFMRALRDEKIVTTATVNDAAVESMSGDSAVVLVSATSRREGPQAPKDQQDPRVWRVVLTMQREGDQIKMSAVEFA